MLIRAARTFLQAFLAVLIAAPVLNLAVPALKAAAVAGIASVLAMFHRMLDPTSVPTLVDRYATPPAPAAPTEAPRPVSDTVAAR
ncbi:MAG: hypothetical protein ACRD0K_00895 [Egibacteraceae bacterium]